MAARDPFLDLPDCLICTHILTKLPLKEVIRCSAVSHRWKRFWTMLPDLRFADEFFRSLPFAIHTNEEDNSPIELADTNAVEKIIDNILMLRSEHIRAFELVNTFWSCDKIRQWILSVASKGVTEITLSEYPIDWDDHNLEFLSALFSCDKLVDLSLYRLSFTRTPTYFRGFQCLKVFDIQFVDLNEDAFELLVKLCPLLETLIFVHCDGVRNLKLVSQSLETLHLVSPNVDSITANCPQLTNLVIKYSEPIWMREVNFPLLTNFATNTSDILERIPTSESLRKLILRSVHDINILYKFPNIEELCISRWDPLPQALELTLSRLKKVHILHSSFVNIAGLSHLLRRMPSLESVTFSLEKGFNSVKDLEFVNRLLSVMSPTCKVLLSQPKNEKVICRNCNSFTS